MISKQTSIFVAGSSGLIGSACLRHFQKEGYHNLLAPSRSELDLFHYKRVCAFLKKHKPEIIIIAAGKVGGIVENKNYPVDFLLANLTIQLNLFKAAHELGVEKIIFFGSSCMYPRECPQPMVEEKLFTGKMESTSIAYATAKSAGIQMCLAYNRQFKKNNFLSVIPNSVYGPNDNFDENSSHVLSALINKIHAAKMQNLPEVELWGTGKPRREFVFSDDVADAIEFLLKSEEVDYSMPINIGIGQDCSIKELAKMIKKIIGYNGAIVWDTSKPDGAPKKLLDNSKILALGWRPKMSLDEGIRKTYEWFLKRGQND